MPSLTSQLIIALRDNVSGPAKNAAAALKRVDTAAKTAGTAGAKGVQNLAASLDKVAAAKKKLDAPFKGLDLAREFGDLKLTRRELQLITKDFEALRGAMRGMKASDALGTFGLWKTRTIADLRDMRREMQATDRARDRMFRGWRGGARFAAGAAGVGGAAYVTGRGVRGTVRAGAVYQREGAREFAAGMTPSESVEAGRLAKNYSAKYPSIDAAQVRDRLRSLRSFTGDFGKGTSLLEGQLQALTVLQSLKGKDNATQELNQFMRGMDVLGKNEDPKVVSQLTNAFIKAMSVDPDLNMGQFSQFARKSKSAGAALSNEFLAEIVPTFSQDMGGPELGTALGTEVSQAISGRGTAKSKSFQRRAGLRNAKGMVDPNLLLSNPYDWINKYAPEAMRRMKLDPAKERDITKFMGDAFSAQTVSNLFTKFITQRDQAERNRRMARDAPEMDIVSGKLKELDPFVAAEGFMAQLRNLGAELAEGPLKSAIPMLNSFTDSIAKLTNRLSENPDLAEKAGWATTAAGGAAGLTVGGLLARKGVRWLFDRPVGSGAPSVGGASGGMGGGWLRGGFSALGPAAQMAMQPDIVDLSKPRGWWTDQYVQPFWQRLRESRQRSRSYGRDFTLGSEGSFSRSPSFVPPSGLKHVTEWNARSVGGGGPMASQRDPWTFGTSPIATFDQSAAAARAGTKSGSAYVEAFSGALKGVDALIDQAMQRWTAKLSSFYASPTITPKFGPMPSASPTGLKTGAAEIIKQKQHAMFADYGMNTA
ncbi:MAG: hypothetical protein R3D69_12025 [Xanthobacteraceae bacterium]